MGRIGAPTFCSILLLNGHGSLQLLTPAVCAIQSCVGLISGRALVGSEGAYDGASFEMRKAARDAPSSYRTAEQSLAPAYAMSGLW